MKLYEKVANHPRIIPLKFGGDQNNRSRFRIRNMNFLKFVIAGELLVIGLAYQSQASTQLPFLF